MSLIIVGKTKNGKMKRITTPESDKVLSILSEKASDMRRGIITGKGKDTIWHLHTFLLNKLSDNVDKIITEIGNVLGEDFHNLVRTTINGGNC